MAYRSKADCRLRKDIDMGEKAFQDYYPEQLSHCYGWGRLNESGLHILDCHCTGTAAAASYRAEGRAMGSEPALRFVTASLHVDYLRPTPLGVPLEVRASVKEVKGRKVSMSATLSADGNVCARGEVVAVRMPEHLVAK